MELCDILFCAAFGPPFLSSSSSREDLGEVAKPVPEGLSIRGLSPVGSRAYPRSWGCRPGRTSAGGEIYLDASKSNRVCGVGSSIDGFEYPPASALPL